MDSIKASLNVYTDLDYVADELLGEDDQIVAMLSSAALSNPRLSNIIFCTAMTVFEEEQNEKSKVN